MVKVLFNKKTLKRVVVFVLAITMFAMVIPTQNVYAEEQVYEVEKTYGVQPLTTLLDCEIIMSFSTDGLNLRFTTGCMDVASVIGVKDIKVQQKMWYGWKTVCMSDGAENQDKAMAIVSFTYPDAVKDRTYRVLATHYADYDGYEEVVNDTGAFKFTY